MSTNAKSPNAKSPDNSKNSKGPDHSKSPGNSKAAGSKAHEAEAHGFSRFAAHAAGIMGASPAFVVATALVVLWGVTGPYFHFSDTWQLVINTATTVVTFLMVFLIQNTQNRDAGALHLKLDEVIRALHSAHNDMIDIERLSDEELERLAHHYEHIREASDARREQHKRRKPAHEQPVDEGGEPAPVQPQHAEGSAGNPEQPGPPQEQGSQRKAG